MWGVMRRQQCGGSWDVWEGIVVTDSRIGGQYPGWYEPVQAFLQRESVISVGRGVGVRWREWER